MSRRDLYDALMGASKVLEVEAALVAYRAEADHPINEIPVGGRPNNVGSIEVAADPGRSAIERITNAYDALLELEHDLHRGVPDCRSPREAASAWLSIPEREGLAGLTVKQRQDLAAKTIIRLEAGEGRHSRLLTVTDTGIGIQQNKMGETILSLNESNKIQKHYLAGTYGQGGSSTFYSSKYTLIASRHHESNVISFTVVRYLDLPPEDFKRGRYVYLVEDNSVLVIPARPGDLKHGTIVKHFGYDLTSYSSPIGPNSVYGLLNRVLFDPVAPVYFQNRVHGWNRVIKGSRNALNGAVDVGDEDSRGPDLDYRLPMFSIPLGDLGNVGFEFWVLSRPADDNKNKNPVAAFVDPRKPIILTHNGQNQGELSATVIRKDADLPFLKNRLICHVNCDRLSPSAKRLLFASTREQSREGFVLARIQEELLSLMKSDDELRRLNEEARESTLRKRDDTVKQQIRQQVARLLRISGASLYEVKGKSQEGSGSKKGEGEEEQKRKRGARAKPEPITLQEPPTFIRIVWEDEEDVPFYATQRRYIRIETDANSEYHDPDDLPSSKINIAVGDDLKVVGTSPLKGGRMRIGVECNDSVVIESTGSIRVELYRKGLPALNDEQGYAIVEPPKAKEKENTASIPDFEIIPVDGPHETEWEYICDDPDDNSISRHASGAVMNEGKLYVYYSTKFPRYATEYRRFEQQDPALARSFQLRYELWVAVHSLLLYQDKATAGDGGDEMTAREMERQERCRLGVLAAMIASQEVKSGVLTEDAEAAA